MVHDGVPDDMSAQSLFDRATSAKNMMSRIRGYSPSQWVLATQPRIPESLMIDDEDEDHVPHKDIPESQDDEFARSIRVRDAARLAFITVDTDQRLRKAAASASRPDRLTFEPGDMCYFWQRSRWLKFWKKCKVSDFIISCPSSVCSSLSVDNLGSLRRALVRGRSAYVWTDFVVCVDRFVSSSASIPATLPCRQCRVLCLAAWAAGQTGQTGNQARRERGKERERGRER